MLATLVSTLMAQGLPMIAEAIIGKAEDKAVDFIKEKTGIDLTIDNAEEKLSDPENMVKLTRLDIEMKELMIKERSMELDSEDLKIQRELEAFQSEEASRENARKSEQKRIESAPDDWLLIHSTQLFSFFGAGAIFWFIYMILFSEIQPKMHDNANMVLSSLVTILITIFAFYVGSSKSSSDKNKTIQEMNPKSRKKDDELFKEIEDMF